jgi:hypothetical protein
MLKSESVNKPDGQAVQYDLPWTLETQARPSSDMQEVSIFLIMTRLRQQGQKGEERKKKMMMSKRAAGVSKLMRG